MDARSYRSWIDRIRQGYIEKYSTSSSNQERMRTALQYRNLCRLSAACEDGEVEDRITKGRDKYRLYGSIH